MVNKDKGPITGFGRKLNTKTGEYYSYPVYGDLPPDLTEEYRLELQKATGGKRFEDLPPYERARIGVHMEAVARRIRGEQAVEVRNTVAAKRAMITASDIQKNRELIEARKRREALAKPKNKVNRMRYNEALKRYEFVEETR